MRDAAKVKLGRLYEKTSQKGTRYFVGRLGLTRVLLSQSRETVDDGGAIWDLYLQEIEDTQPRPMQGEMPMRQPNAGPRLAPPVREVGAFHDDPIPEWLP